MSAVCAACRTPIAKGEKFVLQRTEVFHERCVTRSARSVRAELELRLAGLEGDIAQLRYEVESTKATADHNFKVAERIRAERDRLADQLRSRESNLRAVQRQRDRERADREQLERDLRDVRDAVERMRAAQPPVAPAAPVTAPTGSPQVPTPAQEETDSRDATEIRFGLLELD